MRIAEEKDINYVAETFVGIVNFMKSSNSDIYIENLPSEVNDETLNLVASYISDEDSVVFIEEINDKKLGCIIGSIVETSMPITGLGKVGSVIVCWVEPKQRESGLAKDLLKNLENWFRVKGINNLEVSYMAQNELAGLAWSKLGFTPFRVFSHKTLNDV